MAIMASKELSLFGMPAQPPPFSCVGIFSTWTDHRGAQASPNADRPVQGTRLDGRVAATENGRISDSTQPDSREDGAVVLHGQIITAKDHKVIQVFLVFLVLVSLCAFGFALTYKLTKQELLFRHTVVQSVNIGFASLNVTILSVLILVFFINVIRVQSAGLIWSRRARTIASVAFAQLVVQFINTVFFLFPNVHAKDKRCSWFQTIQFVCCTVRWTCWNTFFLLMAIHTHNICPWLDKNGDFRRGTTRKNSSNNKSPLIIMDAAAWVHLPKFVFWALFEFCIVFLAVEKHYDYRIVSKTPRRLHIPCELRTYECLTGLRYRVLTSLWVVFIFLYVCMIQTYIMQARQRLLLGRYNEFLEVHLMVLAQRKQVWYITIIGVVIVPVLWYTRWDRCNNYFVAWLGMLPLQVIVTAMTGITAFYFMPVPPGRKAIQQEWLQQFVWNESTFQKAKQERSQGHSPEIAEQLRKEPMFCFETAVKLALWSEVVYTYGIDTAVGKSREGDDALQFCPCMPGRRSTQHSKSAPKQSNFHVAVEVEEAPSSSSLPSLKSAPSAAKVEDLTEEKMLKAAMEMYDLSECEVMAEDQLQTRALLGWSGRNLVVAFRGTATMANVISDAKAWRSPHPPARGAWILGQQPLVHKGFLQTWTVNGFNKKVIARIKAIYDARQVPAEEFTIRFTGHSLGGSLSQLAALELRNAHNLPNLFVYTYGCPRTGNHAFCRELDSLVPEHWHLINDRDAVPRSGKFYVLYKRAGQRVLLNQVGDIRVRPSVMEMSIHRSGYSIKQHLMASYVGSLFAICMAQCMQFKCEPGGKQGVEQLAQSPHIQLYFASTGLDLQGAVTGEKEVVLPSLVRKHSRYSWLSDNLLNNMFSALESLLPGLEDEGGLQGLISGNTASGVAQAAVTEDDQQAAPEQLGNRLTSLRNSIGSLPEAHPHRRSLSVISAHAQSPYDPSSDS